MMDGPLAPDTGSELQLISNTEPEPGPGGSGLLSVNRCRESGALVPDGLITTHSDGIERTNNVIQ